MYYCPEDSCFATAITLSSSILSKSIKRSVTVTYWYCYWVVYFRSKGPKCSLSNTAVPTIARPTSMLCCCRFTLSSQRHNRQLPLLWYSHVTITLSSQNQRRMPLLRYRHNHYRHQVIAGCHFRGTVTVIIRLSSQNHNATFVVPSQSLWSRIGCRFCGTHYRRKSSFPPCCRITVSLQSQILTTFAMNFRGTWRAS